MANSHRAITYVLKLEGGYVDHPSDPGGATKYGITQRTLDKWYKSYGVQGFPVKHLSIYQARKIYEDLFWHPMRLDECQNEIFANILFDQAVNQGIPRAVKRAQNAINYTVRSVKLKVDGVVGKNTLIGMTRATRNTHIKFYTLSQTYYGELVSRRSDLAVFIKGWINRTHHMLDEILE